MSGFTELEVAVLHAIFAETPELQDGLERQFEQAAVVQRENRGVGFFTTIAVPKDVPSVSTQSPLDTDIHAKVAGLDQVMGFLVFMDDGRLNTLEGFTYGDVGTSDLDLGCLEFEVIKLPGTRL